MSKSSISNKELEEALFDIFNRKFLEEVNGNGYDDEKVQGLIKSYIEKNNFEDDLSLPYQVLSNNSLVDNNLTISAQEIQEVFQRHQQIDESISPIDQKKSELYKKFLGSSIDAAYKKLKPKLDILTNYKDDFIKSIINDKLLNILIPKILGQNPADTFPDIDDVELLIPPFDDIKLKEIKDGVLDIEFPTASIILEQELGQKSQHKIKAYTDFINNIYNEAKKRLVGRDVLPKAEIIGLIKKELMLNGIRLDRVQNASALLNYVPGFVIKYSAGSNKLGIKFDEKQLDDLKSKIEGENQKAKKKLVALGEKIETKAGKAIKGVSKMAPIAIAEIKRIGSNFKRFVKGPEKKQNEVINDQGVDNKSEIFELYKEACIKNIKKCLDENNSLSPIDKITKLENLKKQLENRFKFYNVTEATFGNIDKSEIESLAKLDVKFYSPKAGDTDVRLKLNLSELKQTALHRMNRKNHIKTVLKDLANDFKEAFKYESFKKVETGYAAEAFKNIEFDQISKDIEEHLSQQYSKEKYEGIEEIKAMLVAEVIKNPERRLENHKVTIINNIVASIEKKQAENKSIQTDQEIDKILKDTKNDLEDLLKVEVKKGQTQDKPKVLPKSGAKIVKQVKFPAKSLYLKNKSLDIG